VGELFVEGLEAAASLGYALTTDPASLKVGRAHYAMICFQEGGILDDLIVYRLADERYMVVANAANAGAVSDALAERLAGFSVVLDDRSLATALVAAMLYAPHLILQLQLPRSEELDRMAKEIYAKLTPPRR
jgi:aminomethyltransferase